MSRQKQPLFLERQSYRRRRLVDASRVIPIFGLCLFLVPLIWPAIEEPNLAARGIYIFVVWIGLVVATGLISYRLKSRERTGELDQLDKKRGGARDNVL